MTPKAPAPEPCLVLDGKRYGKAGREAIIRGLCRVDPRQVLQVFQHEQPEWWPKVSAYLRQQARREVLSAFDCLPNITIQPAIHVPQAAAPVVEVRAPEVQRVEVVGMPPPPATVTTVEKRDQAGRVERTRKAVAR